MSDMTRERIREYQKQEIAGELEDVVDEAQELARALGLDPYPVKYWVVDQDEMNELIAYNGFQHRYPHWRFGMQYDRQQKKSQFTGGKAFEIVNNDNPAHAFLQRSNSIADQKAVITHVEAHSDFFKNNHWFAENPNAADMLERHGERVRDIMEDPNVSREEVEKWIDHCLCLEDTINQFETPQALLADADDEQDIETALEERIEELGVSEEVAEDIFDDDWLEEQRQQVVEETTTDELTEDLMAFLIKHGKQYDGEQERAVDYEDWQVEVLEIMLKESHYFAPQKMTKVMNEGWASYWQSLMMGGEQVADVDEFIEHANHMSMVLNSPGFNPYALGRELWEYIENTANRCEVVEHLLRVDGITARNFHDKLDFAHVQDVLDKRESDDYAERHYSLTKPENQGFIKRISRQRLEEIWRYLFDVDRYDTVEEALAEVDYEAGWNRMFEVRESHNDVTFIDEFITEEFVREGQYFTYEYNPNTDQMEVASKDPKDVKKKLLLQFTNFGKPSIAAADANFNNSGELLLVHDYNGIMLDMAQAEQVLKRVFEMWGRPVNLKTIVKDSEGDEEGRMLRYEGDEVEVERLEWVDVEDIAADDIDYDTKPDDW